MEFSRNCGLFSVSIDELLSGAEPVSLAERDQAQKMRQIRNLIFGLPDCAMAMFQFFRCSAMPKAE